MEAKHPVAFKQYQMESQSLQTAIIKETTTSGNALNSASQVQKEILNMMVYSGLPFTVIENPFLSNIVTRLTSLLEPSARTKSIPKGEYFRRLLPSMYAELELKKQKSSVVFLDAFHSPLTYGHQNSSMLLWQ